MQCFTCISITMSLFCMCCGGLIIEEVIVLTRRVSLLNMLQQDSSLTLNALLEKCLFLKTGPKEKKKNKNLSDNHRLNTYHN